ncbi:MAG: alanine--tRNA ligase [Nitrososphaerota archaeon]|nr:alanine--tRNA ligase [Nitrososphaerota archaeon]MDG6938893.1 alanine--tRNA ligase [Nitrososphaerota archaeon]
MSSKDTLRRRFSSDPEKYYKVRLFEEEGFSRLSCGRCGSSFWTLAERKLCPGCEGYSFISDPPTRKKLGYTEAWKEVEAFFASEGHASIKRYPVVARWRPDLYFTVASIIDFQRVEGGKVIFDFPANPLIVPQMCLRFNDIENVGVTGRHYTSFCMVGQHAWHDQNGYWKDRTIDLDFGMLTKVFGVKKEEVTFVEDVWLGYGAFGYSLEYYVRGLELGNAVFTEFEGTPEDHRTMARPVVDMGAGLERLVWLTHGTPTSYEPVFGPVYDRLLKATGVRPDASVLARYFGLAGTLDIDESQDAEQVKHDLSGRLGLSKEFVSEQIAPLEAIFSVLDHSLTLLFAMTDGALPSNVGGGYNLRVVYRRVRGLLNRFGWNLSVPEVMELHAEHLREMYPELRESVGQIREVLEVEGKRYQASSARASAMVRELRNRKLTVEDMIRLYDSEGITPELLKEGGLPVEVPRDFYGRVTELHMEQRQAEEKPRFDVSGLPDTELLYYEDQDMFDFKAAVLAVFGGEWVALDRTAFYARGGGQEPDRGTMGKEARVVEAIKYGGVVLHKIEGTPPKVGSAVECRVDRDRRETIMRHHTATHIINGAARRTLGPWVWQHSAFKDVDGARLDITHHSRLTPDQLTGIEQLANEVVRQNIPVELHLLPRMEAEKTYGFRLYQGGVVPAGTLRVRKIGEFDVEACGGTHCVRTGDVGLIKITKTERLQDGVERIEFLAGRPALDHVETQEDRINRLSAGLATQPENVVKVAEGFRDSLEQTRKMYKGISRRLGEGLGGGAERVGKVRFLFLSQDYLDDQAQIAVGDAVVQANPDVVYAGVSTSNGRCRIVVFAGREAVALGMNAAELARQASKALGGSGGGRPEMGQGGGQAPRSVEEVERLVKKGVEDALRTK